MATIAFHQGHGEHVLYRTVLLHSLRDPTVETEIQTDFVNTLVILLVYAATFSFIVT
jgi:hypothetical protein